MHDGGVGEVELLVLDPDEVVVVPPVPDATTDEGVLRRTPPVLNGVHLRLLLVGVPRAANGKHGGRGKLYIAQQGFRR